MERFYLSAIFENVSIRVAFYDAKTKPYFKGVDHFLKHRDKKNHKALSLSELERLVSEIQKGLRIKHKGRTKLILKDKSNLMKAYLNLFAFVKDKKERARV